MSERVIRIAAKGDGLTESGRHVAGAVTGDVIAAGGSITAGPHHQSPPCRHFGRCGGCQLQHADDAALMQFVTERVCFAAESHDIAIGELRPTHLSPPWSRRRATLHGLRTAKGATVGFREARSNRIVDMRECYILDQTLFGLVEPLRKLIVEYSEQGSLNCSVTMATEGVDCVLTGAFTEGLDAAEALGAFAADNGLARLAIDHGFGPETIWEPQPVTVMLGGQPVALPANAFLQPTNDGERILVADALDYLEGATIVADLFAGLGTFSFALAKQAKVLAVEAASGPHLSCRSAANRSNLQVHAIHRDLFRNPLLPGELDRFGGLVLDPPRAGAREQIKQIAQSKVHRVAYISCNPSSWARDARMLCNAGFKLKTLRPVGQFRWSTHVELTSCFER